MFRGVVKLVDNAALWSTAGDNADWYEQGVATAQVRLFSLIPVMGCHGADLARSARGRLVVESTWLPSSFLPEFGAHWSEEGSLLQLTMSIDNEDVRVTMRVESDGLL